MNPHPTPRKRPFLISLVAALGLAACNAPLPIEPPGSMLMSAEEAPDEVTEFAVVNSATRPTLVRGIHLSPDAPAVDIYVDDTLVTEDLAYTQFVGPLEVPFGTRNLKVKAANTTATVIDANLELEQGRRYSLYAVGKLASIAPLVFEDTRFAARKAAKLRVLHGAASAPRVDVYLSRPGAPLEKLDPILENVPFKSISSYFRLRPGGLQVRVTLPDTKTVVIDSGALTIKEGDVLSAVAIDKPGKPGEFSAIVINERQFNPPNISPSKTIVEIAAGNPAFSTLVGALQTAQLVDDLSADGPFTVFAPTNDAFAKLSSVPGGEALKQVLLYHVASGRFLANDLLKAGEVTTLQGQKISVKKVGNDVILNGVVRVTTADIQAKNGVIHVIDTVLIPPAPLKTIAEIAAGDPAFSTLVAALTKTNLVDPLAKPGFYTVFAPTNAAFAKLSSLPDGDALKQVLLYHVASGVFDAKKLVANGDLVTLQGKSVKITKNNQGEVILNGAVKVTTADIQASNGIVHVIDTVLIPPLPSIVEIATGNPNFSTLVGALQAADLVGALQGAGPFTVFAPTNAAFAKLSSLPGGEALKQVLLYHVASGKLDAATLLKNGSVMTLQGQRIHVAKNNQGEVILNGVVKVVTADIQASNGIVHVIDTVLIPPTSMVRAIHASSDAPAVNVLVDGAAAFQNLMFGKASAYASVPSGTRNIKVNLAANGATAINADLNLTKDTTYTVIALNRAAQIEALVLNDTTDGNSAPGSGKTKVRLIHGASQAGLVDVYVTAPNTDIGHVNPTIRNFAFKANTRYLELNAGSYRVRITAPHSKTPVIDTGAINLVSGGVFTGLALDPAPGSHNFGALLVRDN